jgi:hypothetical protein
MASGISTTLWSDTPRTRLFLIPNDQQLPPGGFVIRTITGRKLEVDPASLAPFEITEDEARKWLEAQFGNILDAARVAVERFIDRLNGADADRLKPVRTAVSNLERAVGRLLASGPLTATEIVELRELSGRIEALQAGIWALNL